MLTITLHTCPYCGHVFIAATGGVILDSNPHLHCPKCNKDVHASKENCSIVNIIRGFLPHLRK